MSGKYIIRAELIENPDIFDEIEVDIPDIFELKYIKSAIKYEKKLDNINQVFRVLIDRTVNFSKKHFNF